MEHCPPQDEEERKAFLADVLAPISQELCEQLDFSILLSEYGEPDYYFEQDVNEKLRGDLENRFQAMTAAAGRPWTTVNEIRARENLPPVDTGDELTIPLNVMIGDNPRPAPNVMPPQDALEPPQDGSHREESVREALEKFYDRQSRVVQSNGGGFDTARWNKELTADLRMLGVGEGAGELAAQINDATKAQIAHQPTQQVFDQLKADAVRWAGDVDRARVMLVAASLLDAAESDQP